MLFQTVVSILNRELLISNTYALEKELGDCIIKLTNYFPEDVPLVIFLNLVNDK